MYTVHTYTVHTVQTQYTVHSRHSTHVQRHVHSRHVHIYVHKRIHLTRERTEQDLRDIIANKDAESARLHAEINRLRTALSKADGLHGSQASEVQDLQTQLAEAKQATK
jgi:uncharacterized membrane protein YccC